MQLQTGDFVVYRSAEICRVEGIEKQCLDGVNERNYCVLVPVNSERSKYYVPEERMEEKTRGLLSKDEIYNIIDGMSGSADEWCSDAAQRKAMQNEVLACDDFGRIASMLRSLYIEKQKRSSIGKKMLAADERAMRSAESMINTEFAFVLGIKENEVESFICDRLGLK